MTIEVYQCSSNITNVDLQYRCLQFNFTLLSKHQSIFRKSRGNSSSVSAIKRQEKQKGIARNTFNLMSVGNISQINPIFLFKSNPFLYAVSCNRTSARRLIYLKREYAEPYLEMLLNFVYRLNEEIDRILICK